MAYYACYDPDAPEPAPITEWKVNHPDGMELDHNGYVLISPEQFDARMIHSWAVLDGALIEYTPPLARTALEESDLIVLRCFEAGVPVPSAWVDYRKALRTIIRTNGGAMPAEPPAPDIE